ncbi:hypothetical protein [Tabrizicola flagellatus]|uniref:hypothetical protein n=1 Tax=Tabrizicola flagellatus TaxID=2593021 RepID=UPI0011F3D13F|nr:hypothetical protein [Tabrizicola flagellatus]
MAIVIAAGILSIVVVAAGLSGLFQRGPGVVLRVLGAILVLPLPVFWVWLFRNLLLDITVGYGNGLVELGYLVMSLAVGIIGALLGAIGTARARRTPPVSTSKVNRGRDGN